MKYKRFFASIFICTIIALNMCPFFCTPVYAVDNWQNVTTNAQLVEAFRYYCKSRDLTIDGSIADGVTTFTTKTFNGLCNTLGIDVAALQAHLKYETDGNQGLRFLFDSTGITAYNRIFSQFLQDNDLEVGDEVNKNVYDGVWFNDGHNNGCYIYVVNATGTINGSNILTIGSDYRKSSNQIYNDFLNGISTFDFYLGDSVLGTRTLAGSASNVYDTGNKNGQWNILTSNGEYPHGQYVVISASGRLYYGLYVKRNNTGYGTLVNFYEITNNNDKTVTNAPIYITTNNTVINNNYYEGDTIINNDGTQGDDSGGGGNNDDDNWNPTTPTIPDYNDGGGSNNTINWPSIDIPDFNINFSLGNITEKFPFSIPFDLIALLTVLDGEPKAPDLDITIPLIVTDWHFEADFSQFDDLAQLIRAFEFIGFCVYLLYFTVGLVKG